jgi:hypothetical protein
MLLVYKDVRESFMRTWLLACATSVVITTLWAPALQARSGPDAGVNSDADDKGSTLVYADFENAVDGRAVSSRGGKVNLWGYEESPTRQSVFKGSDSDKATPKLVRTSKTDQNHAAAFEYELVIPNEWAGVTMEVQGQPGPEGALPADDVRGYKALSLQAYVTGSSYMRVEIMSNGKRLNLHSGYPMTTFKLKEGFNTYKVPLTAFAQPAWVGDTRIDPKEVLEKLTSITLSVYCEQQCRPASGMVIVDNLVFEK